MVLPGLNWNELFEESQTGQKQHLIVGRIRLKSWPCCTGKPMVCVIVSAGLDIPHRRSFQGADSKASTSGGRRDMALPGENVSSQR